MASQLEERETQVGQLARIATEVRALRDAFAPRPQEVGDAVRQASSLVSRIRSSLLRVNQPIVHVTARWDGATLSEIKSGDQAVAGRFVHVTLANGDPPRTGEIASDASVTLFEQNQETPIARLEIRVGAEGPCLAVGGPIQLSESAADPID